MDPESSGSTSTPTEGQFLLNAFIGAVAGIVLGFVPLSPALGGAIGSYLNGGSRETGLKLGAVAGLMASIPVFAGAMILSLFILAGPGPRGALAIFLLVVTIIAFAALYVVGLSAAGGYLGIYARERRDERRARRDGPAVDEPEPATPEV